MTFLLLLLLINKPNYSNQKCLLFVICFLFSSTSLIFIAELSRFAQTTKQVCKCFVWVLFCLLITPIHTFWLPIERKHFLALRLITNNNLHFFIGKMIRHFNKESKKIILLIKKHGDKISSRHLQVIVPLRFQIATHKICRVVVLIGNDQNV